MKDETKCLHSGYTPGNSEPRVVPIVQSTTYRFDSTQDIADVFDDPTKALVQDWGEGYFIAVGFSNYSSGLTYADVEVGITPTQGAGLVHLDSDQDAVLKVTDKTPAVKKYRSLNELELAYYAP